MIRGVLSELIFVTYSEICKQLCDHQWQNCGPIAPTSVFYRKKMTSFLGHYLCVTVSGSTTTICHQGTLWILTMPCTYMYIYDEPGLVISLIKIVALQLQRNAVSYSMHQTLGLHHSSCIVALFGTACITRINCN